MVLKKYLQDKKKYIDKSLDNILIHEDVFPSVVHEAMRYSIFAGGKRIRPILCIAAAEAVGGSPDNVLPIACALEMIHTYSLIHDDLPAMDDDDFRRGMPTCHKKYGEANAILAGDALLTYAFEIISNFGLESANLKQVFLVSKEIAFAAGSRGMIGGQIVDILSEKQEIKKDTLHYIHNNKTGALIKASVKAGAILGGGNAWEVEKLTEYAENFGLAFQITDDLLDIIGDEAKLGKPIGSDVKNKKATFPALYGIDNSRKMAEDVVLRALDSLKNFQHDTEILKLLVKYLLIRES